MSKKKQKSQATIILFTTALTIALILAGVIGIGLYMKKNEPERYESMMRELRDETTEEPDINPATNPPMTTEMETTNPQNVSVVITIPSELSQLIGDINEEKVIAMTDNADGSVSIEITKEKQKEILNSLREQFNTRESEIVTNQEYSYLCDISHNDDFTMYTVTVTDPDSFRNGVGIAFLTNELKLHAQSFQIFDGRNEYILNVSFVDKNGNSFLEKYYPLDQE